MRGELNIRNEYRNALNRAGLDITAPSTPGTASSMRTNPPSYQRMHSNDSNKGNDSKDGASNGRISDWLDNPSTVHGAGSVAAAKKYLNVSNRFRRASNPALNKHQIKAAASGPKLTSAPSRHHYRHPPTSRHLIGNSALPPLPPSARSHSLDGLLDSDRTTQWSEPMPLASTAEGLNHNQNILRDKKTSSDSPCQSDRGSKDTIRNTTNRRSKSLDDLLDDDQLMIVEDERETQSMENILESASNESIVGSLSPVLSERMCGNDVMLVNNSILTQSEPDIDRDMSQNDSGIQCGSSDTPKLQSDASSFDDTVSRTISNSSSTASEKKSGKTLLNKYVKKVKNFMKKWRNPTDVNNAIFYAAASFSSKA